LSYPVVPLTFLALATGKAVARLASREHAAARGGAGFAAGLIVLLGVLPSLPLSFGEHESPSPPARAAAAVVRAIPKDASVYGPVALYSPLSDREDFGCWFSTGPLGRAPGFRSRYAWIVLWPAGDPPGVVRDAPLA